MLLFSKYLTLYPVIIVLFNYIQQRILSNMVFPEHDIIFLDLYSTFVHTVRSFS